MAELAMKAVQELDAISKPYDPGDFAKLTAEQQKKVLDAEMPVYFYVSVGWSRAHIPGMKEWSEQFTAEYGIEPAGDQARIDEPLRRMRELAKAYADNGLAADEAAAARMAEGYKNAIIRYNQQKQGERRK
jgi:hypothetical protein